MSRRRGSSWSAGGVAVMARSLARAGEAEAARLAGLVGRAALIGREDLAGRLGEHAAACAAGAARARAAALYWVSGPMARLAMDASQDVPAVHPDDAPAGCGLMVMAEPLPAWDTSLIGGLSLRIGERTDVPYADPVPVDALAWELGAGGRGGGRTMTVDLMCRPGRLPGAVHAHQSPLLVAFTTLSARVPARLEGAATIGPAGAGSGAPYAGVLAWLQAAWTLMATPSLTETTVVAGTGKPRNPKPNDAGGRGHDTPSDDGVTVIDLHPQRRRLITDEDDAGGDGPRRRLTTRHVVRGHWTHQPHGKGRALRRLQWIDDYIRGPQDAPLSTRTHVWAWRRQ